MQPHKSTLIYDCEIQRALPPSRGTFDPGILYCKGWSDFATMGIACIAAYDYQNDEYRVFGAGNLDEFQELVNHREQIVGFNSISFDDKLCAANYLKVTTTYDLLVEAWRATGQPLVYTRGVTRAGFRLDDFARYNLNEVKSGNGAQAPIWWQRGQYAKVVDYCLRDVLLLRRLFELGDRLCDPTNGNVLAMHPFLAESAK